MKKYLLIAILALVAMTAPAQKIKENTVDKFSKMHVIKTSYEKIVSDKSVLGSMGGRIMKNVWIAFQSADSVTFLCVKWCCNEILSVAQGGELILLDSDGKTYTFRTVESAVSGKGEGTVGMFGSALYGLNIYYTGDLNALAGKKITDLRIQTTDGNFDFSISEKRQGMIAKLYELLTKEMKK